MASLEKLQEELINREALLASIELENTTPVIIGGYNARPRRIIKPNPRERIELMEEPRPTEIKGLWRWWARALVSGALFTKGINKNIAETNEIISHVLGGSIEGKLNPSKVVIDLEPLNHPITMKLDRSIENIPRLKLIALGLKKKPKAFEEMFTIYKNLKIKLRIYKYNIAHNGKSDLILYKFALASLVISLLFSGIGAITTRGFGSLKIRKIKLAKDLYEDEQLKNIKKSLESFYKSHKQLEFESILRNAFNISIEYIESIILKHMGKQKISEDKLPETPALIPNNRRLFRYEIVKCHHITPFTILSLIGNSVLKQNIKRNCPNFRQKPSAKIHTFILGLPRSVKNTGYLARDRRKTGQLRRISTIGFSVLDRNESLNYSLILIYGMLSNDLNEIKKEIVYKGLYSKPKPLNEVNVVQEFHDLFDCISHISRTSCKEGRFK